MQSCFCRLRWNTVSAAYTGELGTGHFLRYKRKSALTGDFYFKIRFWGFKNLRYKRKSGLSDYGLSGGHCTVFYVNMLHLESKERYLHV